MKFLKNLDLTNNQLTNAALQNLAADGTPTTYGLIWYNTATNLVKYNAGNGSTLIRYLLHDGLLGVANGIATLDASIRLVQDAKTAWDGVGSRSFSQTAANNTVVVSGATGKLAYGWFPTMDLLFANAQPTAAVAMNGQRITGVLCDTSSAATDVATRGYVDGIAQGLKTKGSVRVATQTSTDAYTYTITAGDVTSITGTTIDGVSVIAGDRVLVKDAPATTAPGSPGSTQPGNGIYTVVSAAGPITLARATDMDTWAEVPAAYCWVEEGTVNSDTGYVCTTNLGAGVFKTTGITFTKFATSSGLASGISGGSSNSIVYQSAASTTGFITAPSVLSFLTQTTNAAAPVWATTLGVGNGGTGVQTFTAGYIKSSGGTAALTTLATIPNTDGGTGWNSSGTTGLPYITAGVWGAATAANVVGVIGATAVTNATNATHLPGAINTIPYQSALATTSFAAAAANSVLATNGSNVPSLVRTLPALLSVSTAATVSAAGSTQGTATVLGVDVNIVTTVGASQGVQLPVAVAGMKVTVINKGANILAVYPATGGAIDAIATNTAQNLAVNGMLEYTASSTTQWYSTTNTVIPGVGSATNLTGGATNTVVYQSTTGTTAYLANAVQAAVMIQAASGNAPSWAQYLPVANMPALTGGDVTSANGSGTLTIGANKVTLAQMAQVATASILGRTTAATGNVEVLTGTQARAIIGSPKSAVYTWTNADGATKTIAHGLGAVGTIDAIVRVYDSSVSPANEVYCDVTLTDAASGTITLSASAAPAVSYRVVVLFIGA